MFYANKEKRKELSDLSKKVFGTRGRWHKFVLTRGYTIDSIELQMIALSKAMDEQLKEEINDQTKKTTTKLKHKTPINRKTRRRFLIDRNKARQKQARSGITTTRSSNRSSEGS